MLRLFQYGTANDHMSFISRSILFIIMSGTSGGMTNPAVNAAEVRDVPKPAGGVTSRVFWAYRPPLQQLASVFLKFLR